MVYECINCLSSVLLPEFFNQKIVTVSFQRFCDQCLCFEAGYDKHATSPRRRNVIYCAYFFKMLLRVEACPRLVAEYKQRKKLEKARRRAERKRRKKAARDRKIALQRAREIMYVVPPHLEHLEIVHMREHAYLPQKVDDGRTIIEKPVYFRNSISRRIGLIGPTW